MRDGGVLAVRFLTYQMIPPISNRPDVYFMQISIPLLTRFSHSASNPYDNTIIEDISFYYEFSWDSVDG
jgi:hypothetical protein